MNLKTFTAESMAAALAQVKSRIGPHAVILHTRSYKRGGFLGIGAKTVVEVTAADGRDVGRQRRQSAPRARKQLIGTMTGTPASLVAGSRVGGAPQAAQQDNGSPTATGDLIKRTYAAALAELEKQQQGASQPAPATTNANATMLAAARQNSGQGSTAMFEPASPSTPAGADARGVAGPAGVDNSRLEEEMQSVKRLMVRMMQDQRRRSKRAPTMPLPGELSQHYLKLLEQEVSEELADEIVGRIKAGVEGEAYDDEDACRDAARAALAKLLPAGDADDEQLPATSDGRPRLITLVGPTGVGKTTTVAKLAANFKLKQGKKVGLITLDTFRIAAVDQLRTYAGIIGVPLHVAMSAEELRSALDQLCNCDVVLMDTAGRSQRDDARLGELQDMIDLANPHEVHLVLSSASSEAVLMEAVDRFSRVRVDHVIFTKLDEAVTFGVVLNVARRVNKRLSYFTTGQEVPHDIEPGRTDRLFELLFGSLM